MFTIKWIVKTPCGEIVRMFEAKDIAVAFRNEPRSPAGAAVPQATLKHWEVAGRPVDYSLLVMDPYEPNYAGRSFDSGIVYVMNETGATVGKYVLSDEILPDPPAPLVMQTDSATLQATIPTPMVWSSAGPLG